MDGVRWQRAAPLLAAAAILAGCGSSAQRTTPTAPTALAPGIGANTKKGLGNVYYADVPGALSPSVSGALSRIYVPNSTSNTVDVIDPATFRVVDHFAVGGLPQHVTPAWDLKTLYVDNDEGNSLTPIDPLTGRPRGPAIPVDDPYNLYFTLDGHFAIVVAERLKRLDFRDPQTMALRHSLAVPGCDGVDHMDFSAAGGTLYASCEFAGRMIMVDALHQRLVRTLVLGKGVSSPQDVKLSPDGKLLYVADQAAGGVWLIATHRFKVAGFLHTGRGAHGLYPSRDARRLFVSNRAEGSVSVISFATHKVITKWRLPGRASPDMGGVSADGRTLWLSGRYDAEVYAIDTATGRLRARIKVGQGPHGLSVWPQPGRFSLGHTGILR